MWIRQFRFFKKINYEFAINKDRLCNRQFFILIFFFYVGFLSRTFTNYRTAGEQRGHFIDSSLPLPPTSQTHRHQPGDYCKELTSSHSQQLDSNWEPLVSKRKSLTTKLCAPNLLLTNTCYAMSEKSNFAVILVIWSDFACIVY